ncbi:MAG: PilZ domain-containing protein [Deltaproteobacteria bacterium]|nr:PilZ domain-containing protein [Deltaproteobacteria bacterium]
MASKKEPVDRRQRKRFRVRDDTVVIFRSPDAGMGRLIDISMGGLTFNWVTSEVLPIEATKLDICRTGSLFILYNLPCQSIWELSVYETRPTSLHTKRCGVQFGELTPDQISQLEHFIQNHTTGEVQAQDPDTH